MHHYLNYNSSMQSEVIQKLLAINQEFYQTFALQFSQTRQRLQPGVRAILKRLPEQANILDLGCGNGWLWHSLRDRGWAGKYLGIDSSPELLDIAARQVVPQEVHNPSRPGNHGARAVFLQADLASPTWPDVLSRGLLEAGMPDQFDVILAFAVLHHLPGQALRLQALQNARRFQEGIPGAWMCLSVWQFLNDPRWHARIQSWQAVGLAETQVESGDYLLDWRHGGSGLRYVHLFQEAELVQLASNAGYLPQETYYSDGTGGRLSLYQVWLAQ